MKISYNSEFLHGYTSLVERRGETAQMLMDFGVIVLDPNNVYQDNSSIDERCYMLGSGSATVSVEGKNFEWQRDDRFEQAPWCISVPRTVEVTIKAKTRKTEILRIATLNSKDFSVKHFTPKDCENEARGAGTMQETSTRIVRTIFNFNNHPDSNLVVGEVVNVPGKWSSYPPHHHPQPEIYHYRFKPEQGFGLTCIGERPYKILDKDTILIRDKEDHPQVSAPGYAMWYLWVIRHLLDNPYIDPEFTPEHIWVSTPEAPIWVPKL